MTVAVVADTPSVEQDGETFYFCCEGCKSRFEEQRAHAATPD
jgi:YHS domain-containing protein